ncbi:hypothetical protein [Devosia sp.]|uniref:hypothetical protein n=1 Tax=Devosia sp. TaxID=1871048 RepID=UPI003BA98227
MPRRFAKPPHPTTTADETRLLRELAPLLDRLADDTWTLAQRHPARAAPPSLTAEAGRLLGVVRRLLSREPGHRLLPLTLPPVTTLSALALSLRQAQAALAPVIARHAPPAPRTLADEIDDIARLEALVLRGFATNLAESHKIPVPAALRPAPSPPPPPAPGRPPSPKPLVRKTMLSRENRRRRTRRVAPLALSPLAPQGRG